VRGIIVEVITNICVFEEFKTYIKMAWDEMKK
jgi:hypothetical protein